MRDWDRLRLEHPKALTSMVTESLRQAIIDGDFQLDESMSEDQLSAVFGVSRSPVREALKALEFEGLVEVRPKRGSFIFAPSIEGRGRALRVPVDRRNAGGDSVHAQCA